MKYKARDGSIVQPDLCYSMGGSPPGPSLSWMGLGRLKRWCSYGVSQVHGADLEQGHFACCQWSKPWQWCGISLVGKEAEFLWVAILVISLTACMFHMCAPVRQLKLRILCTEPAHWSEHPSLFQWHSQTFIPLWLIFLKDCWLWKKRTYLRIYSNLEIPFLVKCVISKERESRVNPFLSEYFFLHNLNKQIG